MVLESTVICVDSSDYMRNGDFVPTRLQAQQDAVSLICHAKTRSHPENNVGLVAMAKIEVLMTLTSDVGRVLGKLHQMQPSGNIRLSAGIRVAHLALKHRQGKNHKVRIVIFVGSPVEEDEKELVKLAKRLKKEKVNVDIVNFGEESINTDKLTTFVNTMNGKDGTSSHLVTVPPGPMLSDALLSSPILVGEDGAAVPSGIAGLEYGVDPNEDPELALALRVSMEEQRARQEDEARKAAAASVAETTPAEEGTSEEEQLKAALEMSMQADETSPEPTPVSTEPPQAPSGMSDFSMLTEDEQIALAMQLSMSETPSEATPTPMDTDDTEKTDENKDAQKDEDDEDYDEVINDPEFVQSVLENLPGVDPQSEDIRYAMGQLTRDGGPAKKEEKKKDEKK